MDVCVSADKETGVRTRWWTVALSGSDGGPWELLWVREKSVVCCWGVGGGGWDS